MRHSDAQFNHQPLTPLSFLDRSAHVFGDRLAVTDEGRRWTYRELRDRTTRLAGGLRALGVEPGDRVAVLAPNTHVLLEAHDGVPRSGAVLVALNTRLHPKELAYVLAHSGAKVLIFDADLRETALEAHALARAPLRLVVAGSDEDGYERLLDESEPVSHPVSDERSLLSLNYTSGTTGTPKGVMYHHRGAYLQALAMAFHVRLGPETSYLWTLPMFHTNGWCFPWAVTLAGGMHVCLRKVDPERVWEHLVEDGVTHLCAAPTVLHLLAEAKPSSVRLPGRVLAGTGGAPPSPTLLAKMDESGIDVMHLYGLTETHGPSVLCQWWPEWDDLDSDEKSRRKARQGVGNVVSSKLRVVDVRGNDVPPDGTTIGQLALRGNNVMLGYYRDDEATAAAVPDGWLRTGDLGVQHPDGYVELRDRAKDLIISGGENVTSVEVEQALMSHPDVREAAVVGAPDDRWGEVPVAFVEPRAGTEPSVAELVAHVRTQLAGFKVPKTIRFGPLPRTSTGKIQKNLLRDALQEPTEEPES